MKQIIAYCILLIIVPMLAQDPVVPLEFSDMFNERGFYKSNAVMADLNEIISEFNGNLSLSFPLFHIKGKGGLDVNLSLNYNGSIGYTVINENTGTSGHQRDWFNVNGPGWVLSLNGITIQVFNFETAYFSRSVRNGNDWLSNDGNVSLLTSGYHYTDNISWYGTSTGASPTLPEENIITLMNGDGSTFSLINPKSFINPSFNGGFSGEFRSDDRFGRDKALVWFQNVQPHNPRNDAYKNRLLNLYRGDGRIITYVEQLTELYLSPTMLDEITLQQFYPYKIIDAKGNTIQIDYYSSLDPDNNPVSPNYQVIGHPLVKSISIPGVNEGIEFEYIYDDLGEALFGLVIRFEGRQYLIYLQGAGGSVVDFPLEVIEDWDSVKTIMNTRRDDTRDAIGYVSQIIDPEGRATNFYYQTYHRKVDLGNSLAYDWVPQNCTNCSPAPNKFDIRFSRINKIEYPEGRTTEFVYWENSQHAIPGYDLEQAQITVLGLGGLGFYESASRYKCEQDGTGGIGRDAWYNNIVALRTVRDGLDKIREDRYIFQWNNFQYSNWGEPTSAIGYKSQDYEDLYTTIHEQYSFTESGVSQLESKTIYKYRMMPYTNLPKFTPDIGMKILLKSVSKYSENSVFHDSTSTEYFGEAGYSQYWGNRIQNHYFFSKSFLEKIKQIQTFAGGVKSGTETWDYQLASDSLTFQQIQYTDRLGQTKISTFDTDFLIPPDSLKQDSYYQFDIPDQVITFPDTNQMGAADTLSRSINRYYLESDKTEFQFLTIVKNRPDPVNSPDSLIHFYQHGILEVGYQYIPPPTQNVLMTGEIKHEAYIGFKKDFPDTLKHLSGVQSVKLRFYVHQASGAPLQSNVYTITEPWNPQDTAYHIPGAAFYQSINIVEDQWHEVDITNHYNAWKYDHNNHFYGIKIAIDDTITSPDRGYYIFKDTYHPDNPQLMLQLEINTGSGNPIVYTSYNGYQSPVGGTVGQKKREIQFNYGNGIARKETSFLYYLYGAFGNLYQIKDFNGNISQFFYENRSFDALRVYDDGNVVTQRVDTLTNYVVAPLTQLYPEGLSGDTLKVYRMVNALGLPMHTIDANGVLYDYKFDKIGRISSLTYPHDFFAPETVNVDTSWKFYVGEWIQAFYNVKYQRWEYNQNAFRIEKQYVVATNGNTGYQKGRLYLKFTGLDTFAVSNLQSAKLHIFCKDIELNTGSTPLSMRLQSVNQSWNTNYNNSQPPSLGNDSTVVAVIDSGWNVIDLTPWVQTLLATPDSGLCLYITRGDSQSYLFDNTGFNKAYLEITATFSKPLETHYTFKQEYFDSENRLVSHLRQYRQGAGFQNIIDSQSESLYDGLGRITETRAYYDDANYYATLTGYTYADQVDSLRNANGHTTYNDYDFLNRLTRTTFADGNSTRKGYGYTGTLSAVYNPISNADHFLNEIPAGSFFSVDTTIDELGRIKLSYSDAVGNLRQEIVDPGGLNLVTNYYYNALYQQVRVEKPEGDEVRYRYNSFGELLRRESPDAGISEYHYDPNANLRFTQDANLRAAAKVLFTGYDGLNRPTVTGIAAGTDSAAFAELRGDSTYSFEGDTAAWISVNHYDKTPDPAAYPWNQYDITGVAGQMRNLKGRLAANAYRSGAGGMADDDTLTGQYGSAATFTARQTLTTGNPFEVTAPGGNVTLKAGQKITLNPGFHAYSGSRFSAAIDTALQNAPQSGKKWQLELYSYDYRGRVEKKWVFRDLGGEPVEPQVTYSYEYNSQNALTKTTVQVGTESFYHFYEYDRLGQLVKVYTSTDGNKPAQADVVYAYNPVGAVDTLRYGEQSNGFTVELPYRYNVREWLTDIADVSSGAAPFAAKYSYFANGNIQESEYRNSGSLMEQRYKYAYGYDNANRLLSADYQYFSSSWQNPARFDVSGLQYDGNGNILGLVRKKEDNSTIDNLTYAYIAGTNKLQSVTDAVGVSNEDWDAESSTFAYDGNGNVIEMLENGQLAISAITYDHRNLPVSLLNRNGEVVNYRYNAAGQRIYKKIGSQTAEHYILDGDQTVAVYENGAVEYWNILANGVVGRYEPGSGSKFYYLKDHLGSTRAVVNASGTVVEAHDYYPFGLLMPGRDYQSGERTKELFTGKERDGETGLDYFGARYYWAAGGRWWSVDPLLEKYQSFSPYIYSANNPTSYIDTDGKKIMSTKQNKAVEKMLQEFGPRYFKELREARDKYYKENPIYLFPFSEDDFLSENPYTFDEKFPPPSSMFDLIWGEMFDRKFSSTTYYGESKKFGKFEIYTVENEYASGVTVLDVAAINKVKHGTFNPEMKVIILINSKGEIVGRIYMTNEQYNNFLELVGEPREDENENQE